MTIKAEMILDSVNRDGKRICTMRLRYPKFIHGEFMTHRVFSRNASSSRAIPVRRMIEDVIRDPVFPMHWGKNQPGMQAKGEHNEPIYPSGNHPDPDFRHDTISREAAWSMARTKAIDIAQMFERAGYHKQIVNRLIEPFCHINVLVTSTEWDNFFELRDHEDAQPEIVVLAREMKSAMVISKPQVLADGQWHLPFIETADRKTGASPQELRAASAARCARVSYLTFEGEQPTLSGDLALYSKLVGARPLHASPLEHQAFADPAGTSRDLWGNFFGWGQFRKIIEKSVTDDLELKKKAFNTTAF